MLKNSTDANILPDPEKNGGAAISKVKMRPRQTRPWTLEQLKTRFPSMVKQAGYEEIAEKIDQQTLADQLTG